MTRCLPPVHSQLSFSDLAKGLSAASGLRDVRRAQLQERLRATYNANEVELCDSGTSALTTAFLLLARGRPFRVACPAYVCVNVGAAAQAAGVQLVLYDTDSRTMSVDVDSLTRVVRAGVDAVLIAHLFGYPVDAVEAASICRAAGVPLIEDAAQEAGCMLGGRRGGSFGDLSILSFGRGKGATGGSGGALLLSQGGKGVMSGALPEMTELLHDWRNRQQKATPRGWIDVAKCSAQLVLGRPSLYWLPLSIPGLELGEMVYEEASSGTGMSDAAVEIVQGGLNDQSEAVAGRRLVAATLMEVLSDSSGVRGITPLHGAEPAYLRFPIIAIDAPLTTSNRIGAVRGYPRLLNEEPLLRSTILPGEEQLRGARELGERLFTLPTHSYVREEDFAMIRTWFGRNTGENL